MRVFRKLWSFITTFFVVVMLCLAFLLVGVRLIGLTPYAVLSGSMEPNYHVGSLIYVQDIAPQDIVPCTQNEDGTYEMDGTPITFVVNEDLLLATHRVVGVEYVTTKLEAVLDENDQPMLDESGQPLTQEVPLEEPAWYFQTKGDANEDVDGSLVHHKNVVGTPKFSIPYLGYLSSWLQTRKGMIMGISIALVLLILTFLPDLLNAVEDDPQKKKKKKKRRKKKKKSSAAAQGRKSAPEPKTLENNGDGR